VEQTLWARLKEAMKRLKKLVLEAGGTQQTCLSHFGVIPAVALESEGGRQIKWTEKLTQFEFQRAIKIREKQLEDDTEVLNAMRAAYKAVEPDWGMNPTLTFEEVFELYLKRMGKQKGAA
jgi:hypothetical protein